MNGDGSTIEAFADGMMHSTNLKLLETDPAGALQSIPNIEIQPADSNTEKVCKRAKESIFPFTPGKHVTGALSGRLLERAFVIGDELTNSFGSEVVPDIE